VAEAVRVGADRRVRARVGQHVLPGDAGEFSGLGGLVLDGQHHGRGDLAELHDATSMGAATARSRLILRRSCSDFPPQMPNRSSFRSAYSRHSVRTGHAMQTFFAWRLDAPFSGKKASGSV